MSLTESQSGARPAPGLSRAGREYLEEQLDRLAGGRGPALITLPAPAGRAESLLRRSPGEPAFFWCSAERGDCRVGIGAARTIRTAGGGRLESLREKGIAALDGIEGAAHPDAPSFAPRIFGGLSFAVGGGGEEPWSAFGDGAFSFPRWMYVRSGDEASLTLATGALDPEGRAAILREYDEIRRSLAAAAPGRKRPGSGASLQQMSEQRWSELVEAIRDGIETGRFEKIVAARRSIAELEEEIDVPLLLERLGETYPGCYRFAFRQCGATFVGATPERLVRKEGDQFWTEALAGSIGSPSGAGEPERGRLARELLSSDKDRSEHRIVVESLRRRLEPICAELRIPPEPVVLELSRVMHLHTPIRGRLKERSHILDLLSVLHPTPSVGGVPTVDAIDWIARHEPEPRGWYAGPIGWFDGAGDGEFAVALRCGLIKGRRAYVYAGAGIVRDSDPAKEYVETDIKQQALLRALGIRA